MEDKHKFVFYYYISISNYMQKSPVYATEVNSGILLED